MKSLNCKICLKSFVQNRQNQITCSGECSIENGRRLRKEWVVKNRRRYNALARKYYKKNSENKEFLKNARERYYAYKELYPERIRETNNRATKRYQAKDTTKLKRRFYAHNRRLDKKTFLDIEKWIALVRSLDYRCQGCMKKLDLGKLEIDHIKPISKGGTAEIDNLQPLCRSCNAKKGNKFVAEQMIEQYQCPK